jgi:hypothetical protein
LGLIFFGLFDLIMNSMIEGSEQGVSGFFRRLFGLSGRSEKPAVGSETPSWQADVSKPEWLRREEERLNAKAAKVALSQSRQGPPSGESTAPSVKDTRMSPFEAAARRGTLPSAVTGGSEAEQGRAKIESQIEEAYEARLRGNLQARLDLESKSPK